MISTVAENQFGDYIAFIESTTGITVPETDYRNLGDAVTGGASSLGLTLEAYLATLSRDAVERERFLNRITIGETYFFREERHFRALKDRVFPMLQQRTGEITIWSATCATGEEAWSLAAFAQAHLKKPFVVYATDLNSDSIEALKKGRYSKNSFREDGSAYRDIIMRFASGEGTGVTIAPELADRVKPLRLNLFADPLDRLPDDIDIIFFRNTLIYMKTYVKMRVVDRLAKKLAPDGVLFLASSEMPLIMNRELALQETEGVYYFMHAPITWVLATADAPAAASPAAPAKAADLSMRHAAANTLSLNENDILRAAALLDKNSCRGSGDRDPGEFMAQLLLYALHFINRARASAAREIIELIEKHFVSPATWHIRGLVEIMDGNAPVAAMCFRKALDLDARFWPARFYLASVMKATDIKRALEEFRSCRDDLAASAHRDAVSYHFLLEGFSEKYFLEICEHMIRTLGKKNRDGK